MTLAAVWKKNWFSDFQFNGKTIIYRQSITISDVAAIRSNIIFQQEFFVISLLHCALIIKQSAVKCSEQRYNPLMHSGKPLNLITLVGTSGAMMYNYSSMFCFADSHMQMYLPVWRHKSNFWSLYKLCSPPLKVSWNPKIHFFEMLTYMNRLHISENNNSTHYVYY